MPCHESWCHDDEWKRCWQRWQVFNKKVTFEEVFFLQIKGQNHIVDDVALTTLLEPEKIFLTGCFSLWLKEIFSKVTKRRRNVEILLILDYQLHLSPSSSTSSLPSSSSSSWWHHHHHRNHHLVIAGLSCIVTHRETARYVFSLFEADSWAKKISLHLHLHHHHQLSSSSLSLISIIIIIINHYRRHPHYYLECWVKYPHWVMKEVKNAEYLSPPNLPN